jgi:predicted ATPase
MLLEHPEEGIHRGLLRKLVDLLRDYSDQTQLIVTSHSPVVFNTLDPESVRLVTMENEGLTKVRALSPDELGVADRYLEEEGSLSDFLETVEDE